MIAGTNTVEGTQTTNSVATTATTTISDPDGSPGSGDETATPGTLSVTYADETWTAAASGPINFREFTTTPPVTTTTGGINITAVVAGIITVRFGCDPGTVVESAPPSTIVYTDPAATFASTTIGPPPPVVDISGQGGVIVNGPTSSTKTSKSFVLKVTNLGTGPTTVDPATDISSTVSVNGATVGSVAPNSGAKTLSPGASTRVKLVWSYPALAPNDAVMFNACVNVAGDSNTGNNCGSATATAK